MLGCHMDWVVGHSNMLLHVCYMHVIGGILTGWEATWMGL